MTPTPTLEQIKAEENATVGLHIWHHIPLHEHHAVARGIAFLVATARLEGEAKGRAQGLDEAANEMEIWFDNFMRQSHGMFQSPQDAILALKEKPGAPSE